MWQFLADLLVRKKELKLFCNMHKNISIDGQVNGIKAWYQFTQWFWQTLKGYFRVVTVFIKGTMQLMLSIDPARVSCTSITCISLSSFMIQLFFWTHDVPVTSGDWSN